MKKLGNSVWMKSIISVVLAVVLFATSYLFSFELFKGEQVAKAIDDNITFSTTDPECYYLKKASPNISFEIRKNSAANPQAYVVTDDLDNVVETGVKNGKTNETFIINPPKGGYTKGEIYTLVLAEGTEFADESLRGAKKLIFTIDMEEMSHYKFGENVVEVNDTLTLDSSGMLVLPENGNYTPGNILFGKNADGEYAAYKIDSIYGNRAEVELPAADELYEELRVFREIDWDVTALEQIGEMKEEIVGDVVSSDYYTELVKTAYEGDEEMITLLSNNPTGEQLLAAQNISLDDFEFEWEIGKDKKSFSFSITIPINPGNAGLFGIEELKSHSVNITLSFSSRISSYVNIKNVKTWDLSYTVHSTFSWSVELKMIDGEAIKEDPDLDDFFNKTSDSFKNQKFIKRITDKIDRMSKDVGDVDIELFEWKIPIPNVPGLFFEAEIEFVFSMEVCASIVVGNTYTTSYTSGICLNKGTFTHYTDEEACDNDPTLSIRGSVGFKVGMQVETMLCFIDEDIANISLTPQVGAYFDIYALAPIAGTSEVSGEKKFYMYAEFGVYMQVEFEAYVNLWWDNDLKFGPLTFEKKWPLKEFGSSEISLSVEAREGIVFAQNGYAQVPELVHEYYDAQSGLKGADILASGEYELFDENGNQISVNGGKIEVPAPLDSDGMVVVVKYKNDNGKELETEFVVVENISIVEGRVSAFNRGNYTPLSGAKVSLYESENLDTAIASKTTEDDGRFRFNVKAGSYKLVIWAPGYKALSTTQVIRENETKYTEHLMLLDDTMDGKGTSHGTICDALNGNGIANVTIKLRNEWNNTTGEPIEGFVTNTNSSGYYIIEDMPIGYYTVEATVNGYITTYNNILVLDDRDLVNFDFAMTPTLEEGKVRIILNWGERPSDLDSHLIGRTPDNNSFNVYYSAKSYNYGGATMAFLDHDDTSSYGPETITILENIHGTYTYAVHDYSNRSSTSSNALSLSGARIRVMVGGRDEVQEFYVPTDRTGTYWTVFTIDSNYNIVPINTVSNVRPEV